MKCPECGAVNNDQDRFCAQCGYSLQSDNETEAPSLKEEKDMALDAEDRHETSEALEDTAEAVLDANQEAEEIEKTVSSNEMKEAPEPVPEPAKKKSKAPVIIGSVIGVLILAAVGIFGYVSLRDNRTPQERLTDALFAIAESERGSIRSVITIDELNVDMSDEDAAMIADLLKDMEIVSVFKYDVDTRQIEGNLNLEMMGTTLLNAGYYLDKEYLMLDIPLIYDKALSIRLEDLVNLVQSDSIGMLIMYSALGMDMTDIGMEMEEPENEISAEQVQSTVDILMGIFDKDQYESYRAIDQAPYKEIVTAYFNQMVDDDELVENEDGYNLSMWYNLEETAILSEDLTGQMLEDDQVVTFLEEAINKFFGRVIEDKNFILYSLIMEDETIEVTEWEDAYETDLETKRKEIIEELRDSFEKAEDELEQAVTDASYTTGMDMDEFDRVADIQVDWQLDSESALSSQTVVIDMDMSEITYDDVSMKITVKNDFTDMGQSVAFDGIDHDNGVDVGELSQSELMALIGEIQKNLTNNFMDNPLLSDLFYLGY